MITAILGILSPIINNVLNRIPNPVEREKARLEMELKIREQEAELLKAFQASDASQAEINKIEAASEDKFKSYWRPAVAWVCVVAYAWMYVIQPVVTFVLVAAGHTVPELPHFDLGEMTPVLMGMLGLASLRSLDKRNGTA